MENKPKGNVRPLPAALSKVIRFEQEKVINDYGWQRKERQRQTLNSGATGEPMPRDYQAPENQFRSQRNSNSRSFLRRDNNLLKD
jgi:hypothetical protein